MSHHNCATNSVFVTKGRIHRLLFCSVYCIMAVGIMSVVALTAVSAQSPGTGIKATGCFLRLKEQANVPAREQGVLKELHVNVGDAVNESDLLVSLDDKAARLALQLAEIDFAVAVKREKESVTVKIARATAEESAKLLEQAQLELSVAQQTAASDISIRKATSANQLAQEELDRAITSRQKFATSVSDLELARLRQDVVGSGMDIEQARHEQRLHSLGSQSAAVIVQQQQIAVTRLNLERERATSELGISSLTVERTRKSVDVAKEQLSRRQLTSPLTGIVVEKLRHRGEWVEVGEPVLRIIRIDRLFVEGYVDAALVDQSSRGRPVSVTGNSRQGPITVEGTLIFVSPEIDSVNGQVEVKAEISNPALALRPGQPVQMTIP